MYQEVLPNQYLSKYIECFWYSKSLPGNNVRVVPDGCMDIILNYNQSRFLKAELVGTMTEHIFSSDNEYTYQISIRFKPGGIYPLIKDSLHQFNNKIVDLELISKDITCTLNEIIEKQYSIERSIVQIQKYLTTLYINSKSFDKRIYNATEQILNNKGENSIDKLSKDNCLSLRQFERKFKSNIGIGPKLLCRIVKFRNIYKLFNNKSFNESFMNTAFDNNYFDHAHLTKDFKAFAGITPSEYIKSI